MIKENLFEKMQFCKTVFLMVLFLLWMQGCNYHYHQGLELEKKGRFEEANIEYHRAYTQSPGDVDFKEAYLRTSAKTTEDLLVRYEKYLKEKKYSLAFRRLEQARTLSPNHPKIVQEQKRWFRILLAGKVDLVKIKSLQNQIPLTDQIALAVRINTPNARRRLEAIVNDQTNTFSVEDILYDPPQNILMLYSINSIGVKLVNNSTRRNQFKKFIDFRIPVLVDVQGALRDKKHELTSVKEFYPVEVLKESSNDYWFPQRGIRYSLQMKQDAIYVSSTVESIDFLPHMLYMNRRDRRYFLDFGHYQLSQKKIGGLWYFRRAVLKERKYLEMLQKSILLGTYFYYREGGYPYLLSSKK